MLYPGFLTVLLGTTGVLYLRSNTMRALGLQVVEHALWICRNPDIDYESPKKSQIRTLLRSYRHTEVSET